MVRVRYSEVRGGAMRVVVRSASLGGLRLTTLVHRFASRLCSCQEHHGSGRRCEARGGGLMWMVEVVIVGGNAGGHNEGGWV